MFRFELEKFRRQRLLVGLITLLTLVLYLCTAFRGTEIMAGWSQQAYWNDTEYRQSLRDQPVRRADAVWAEQVRTEYHAFVEENRRSDSEIRSFMSQFYDEQWSAGGHEAPDVDGVISDLYNFDNAMEVLTDEAYHSHRFEEFSSIFQIYLPLSQKPAEYVRRCLAQSEEDTSYSARQLAQRDRLVDRIYRDFTPTMGSACGWDVLVSVGQWLPYLLGLALLVALCTSFSAERAASMTPLLQTSRYGRRRLVNIKLARVWLLTTALWLLFQSAMLVTVALAYGLSGWSVTVMHTMGCPSFYGLSNLEYYLIQLAFSYLGTLAQALLICLLSCLCSVRLSLPLGLTATLVAGYPNYRYSFADQCFSPWQKLTALTPAQLMGAFTPLQTYQSYDVGICILPLPLAAILALTAEITVCVALLHRLEGGK